MTNCVMSLPVAEETDEEEEEEDWEAGAQVLLKKDNRMCKSLHS